MLFRSSGLGAIIGQNIKEAIKISTDFLSGLLLGKNGDGGGTDWAKEGATIAEDIKAGIEGILNTGTSLLVGLLTGDATEAGTWTENVGKILGALRQAFSGVDAAVREGAELGEGRIDVNEIDFVAGLGEGRFRRHPRGRR